MAKEQRKFDLEERLINFAVRAIAVVAALPKTLAGMHLGNQLVRCSTLPAHNYAEAQGAESPSDFIHELISIFVASIATAKKNQRRTTS